MKTRFGFIGKEEIELAKEELISSYGFDHGLWMDKNLWYEKPHTGNYIKGYAYNDVEELLHEYECSLDEFDTKESINEFIEEFEYSFSDDDLKKINSIIDDGKVAYMLNEEIDDDKSYLIFNKIEDGQYMWKGTVEEAYKQLEDWNGWDNDSKYDYTELLVIGILK